MSLCAKHNIRYFFRMTRVDLYDTGDSQGLSQQTKHSLGDNRRPRCLILV